MTPICMTKNDFNFEGDGRYYSERTAAFVRGKLGGAGDLSPEELIGLGKALGLRLHKFKRQAELPRVRKVLGVLQGLAPASLLDTGSGRGAFLWPLLNSFPHLAVIALDHNPARVADIDAVRRGGRGNLRSLLADATAIGLADDCVDVVTALEVLEHPSGTPPILAANCASIALACARRTMRESALFMSKPGPQRWPNGIAPVSLAFRQKSSTGCSRDGNRLI
jgi:hypothetical protein